ncbi:MAG: hypothetical protein EBR17_04755 [Betaproteobacteria bacterium]|nr:hypothetical protein [Betaproteobacteria bacterium]
MIFADVRVKAGVPLVKGDLAIGGVPGTGSPIGLDFSHSAGAATGNLLPFGEHLSVLDVPGYGSLEVSVIDCANLVIFVAAASLGMQGTEAPMEIDGNQQLVARINAIRQAVAYRVGLRDYWDSRKAPASPFLVAVSQSTSYPTFTTGSMVEASSIDLVCRSFATGTTHQAMPVTVTSCTGAACRIEGSVANRMLSARARERDLIEIGHPSGTIAVESRVQATASGPEVTLARRGALSLRVPNELVQPVHHPSDRLRSDLVSKRPWGFIQDQRLRIKSNALALKIDHGVLQIRAENSPRCCTIKASTLVGLQQCLPRLARAIHHTNTRI